MAEDVLIIGGGIIGVSTAYVLARAGVSVTLVEKGELADGSSWGNAGLICPCHSKPVPGPGVLSQGLRWMLNPESPFYIKPRFDPKFFKWLLQFRSFCNEAHINRAVPLLRDMQRASLALYREWIAQEGIESYFTQVGGLELFLTREKFEQGRHEVEEMTGFGIDLELLERDRVLTLEPAVNPNIVGGIRYNEDAHIDPALFVEALGAAARAHGAQILTQTEVTGLEAKGRRLAGVRTSRGAFHPEQVVLAAGAWSSQITKRLNLSIPMQPAKGYSITMKHPPVSPKIPLHLAEARGAITPMGPHLRFAGTLELSGLDSSINERRVNAIMRNAKRYLADFGDPEVVRVWAGMRPLAPDGLPYIGRAASLQNLIVATGHSMLGVSMGPVTGEIVGALVMGEKPLLDVSAFAVERFE